MHRKCYIILFSLLFIGCSTSKTNIVIDDYKVIRVVDGDTIEVHYENNPEYVRIIGIDAPEKEECFSKEASEQLKKLIEEATVTLISKPDENRDKYNRLLRYILSDGKDIGAELIKGGFARNYPRFPHPKLNEYKNFELDAQKNQLGLWRECVINN